MIYHGFSAKPFNRLKHLFMCIVHCQIRNDSKSP